MARTQAKPMNCLLPSFKFLNLMAKPMQGAGFAMREGFDSILMLRWLTDPFVPGVESTADSMINDSCKPISPDSFQPDQTSFV